MQDLYNKQDRPQGNQDIRCGQCLRKLAVGQFLHLSIKCPRCKTMNDYRDNSNLTIAKSTITECQRASNSNLEDVYVCQSRTPPQKNH